MPIHSTMAELKDNDTNNLENSNNTSMDDNRTIITYTLMEYLALMMGPQRQDLGKAIPITIIYIIIFIMGVFGNVTTCIVIASKRYMHTATHYYLFNLAVSDMLMLLIGLPVETFMFWRAYPWELGSSFCQIRVLAAETCTNASILTITGFTIERYVAICHPMRSHAMSSLSRVVRIICGVWVVSVLSSLPIVLQYGVTHLEDGRGAIIPESAKCSLIFNEEEMYEPPRLIPAFMVSAVMFFLVPTLLITLLYGMIALTLRSSTSHLSRTGSVSRAVPLQNLTNHRTSNTTTTPTNNARYRPLSVGRKAALKMLVAVVIAFVICWAPFHAQRLFSHHFDYSSVHMEVVFYLSGVLYYISAVINPILYNIMSLKFRQAFLRVINCAPGDSPTRLTHATQGRNPGNGNCCRCLNPTQERQSFGTVMSRNDGGKMGKASLPEAGRLGVVTVGRSPPPCDKIRRFKIKETVCASSDEVKSSSSPFMSRSRRTTSSQNLPRISDATLHDKSKRRSLELTPNKEKFHSFWTWRPQNDVDHASYKYRTVQWKKGKGMDEADSSTSTSSRTDTSQESYKSCPMIVKNSAGSSVEDDFVKSCRTCVISSA